MGNAKESMKDPESNLMFNAWCLVVTRGRKANNSYYKFWSKSQAVEAPVNMIRRRSNLQDLNPLHWCPFKLKGLMHVILDNRLLVALFSGDIAKLESYSRLTYYLDVTHIQ